MLKNKDNFYSGLNVLITGASSGIGRELALQLIEKGANVFAVSRNMPKLQSSLRPSENNSGNLELFSADISKYDNCKMILDEFSRHFDRLDILINNAGVGHFSDFVSTKKDDYEYVINTNLTGPFYLTQLFFGLLKKSGRGRIVNISSSGAFYGVPFRSIYCAAKAGLRVWSQAITLELRRFGIEVFIVIPGSTKTDFFNNQIGKAPQAHRIPGKIELPESLAKRILRAVPGRGKEINHAFSSRVILYLSVLTPTIIKKLITRAIKSEEPYIYKDGK